MYCTIRDRFTGNNMRHSSISEILTHNRTISPLRVRLVVDMHNSRKKILQETNSKWLLLLAFLSCHIQLLLKCRNKHEKWRPCTLTANVFPDPVWAIPTMSLPLRATGKPWDWIAVGSLKFCCINTSITYSARKTKQRVALLACFGFGGGGLGIVHLPKIKLTSPQMI